MKSRDYEKAWHVLKEKMLSDYVKTHKEVEKVIKPNSQYHLFQVANAMVGKNELRRLLKHMDNLDGTREFANLLHDLERGK
ncbi:hypothetical protein [Staphylococcus simulans]|uniref:hypothetical protein n=1 Tax=Staphylococcus simulans TaxID=1286 RepID=UPI00399B9F3B